jgi:hypothetical protein
VWDALADVLGVGVTAVLVDVGVVVGVVVGWLPGSALAGMPNADAGAQAACAGVPGCRPGPTGGLPAGRPLVVFFARYAVIARW